MSAITQTCQTCHKQFLVIDQEQKFLRDKGLPFPLFCPLCRQQRRLKMRGNRQLFRTHCQKCQKDIIVGFNPQETKNMILCKEDYDQYANEVDPVIRDPLPQTISAESFFAEFKRIIQLQPLPPLKVLGSENCHFVNDVYYSKNVSHSFDVVNCTESLYIFDAFACNNCIDCDYPVESELCYESVDPFKAFNCNYISYCARIQDSSYCHWCWNSHDLFGCVYLENKSFCIFNRQLTEEEYREKVKIYQSWPAEKVLAIVEKLKSRYPITETVEGHNENSNFGNYVHYNKNCYYCFDAAHDEDCCYVFDTYDCKKCFDISYGSENQLSYEVVSAVKNFNCNFLYWSENCMDSSYLLSCVNVKDSLGCIGLQHKQYCLLNRQYTKDEYEQLYKTIFPLLSSANLGWHTISF